MNHNLERLMIQSGYAAPHLAGRAHKLKDLIVRDCLAVVEAKRALCGSGVPDEVLLDMVIKDLCAYFGVER